jgi:hypothetical protein
LLAHIEKVDVPPAAIDGAGAVVALSHRTNASFLMVNAALRAGATVWLADEPVKTANGMEKGAFVISGLGRDKLDAMTRQYSAPAIAVAAPAHTIAIKKARIGLYRPWAPSIDEGWTRWALENYGFEPISLYNADIRSANLRSRYDVIVLPDMSSRQLMDGFGMGVVPGRYAGGIGQDGLDNLREFTREGGTLVALNRSSSALIPLLSLLVQNVLDGVKSDKFFCSGALVRVETEHAELPTNFGLSDSPVVMFQSGPAFQPLPGFRGATLAHYSKQTNPLESGLLLHPEAIEGKAAAVELVYGRGRIVLYGFKPQFRGQSHATYKYLFNELYAYEHPDLPAEAVAAPAKPEAAAPRGAKPAEPDDDDFPQR